MNYRTSHDEWLEKIFAKLSGHLLPSQYAELEEHLLSCSGCAQAMSDYEFIARSVIALTEDEPLPQMPPQMLALKKEIARYNDRKDEPKGTDVTPSSFPTKAKPIVGLRTMCKGKIHRATVTHVDLNFVGSITIDQDLLDAANIYPYEKVQVVNINNGSHLETYTTAGARGSGVICLNGAAARLNAPGDLVIVISYAQFTEEEIRGLEPHIVFVDADNRLVEQKIVPLVEMLPETVGPDFLEQSNRNVEERLNFHNGELDHERSCR